MKFIKEASILQDVLGQAKISHGWMLESIVATSNELKGEENFSDELKHSIMVQELMETI
jgi:hypothetical protein